MSRPLELHTWERSHLEVDGSPCYRGRNGRMMREDFVDRLAQDKTLTTAECCAEYWQSWNLLKTGSAAQRDWTEYDRAMTLHRFAITKAVTSDGQVR